MSAVEAAVLFATIEQHSDRKEFIEQLSAESGVVNLEIETWRRLECYESVPFADFKERLTNHFKDLRRDVVFRAWNECIEYAWLGTQGVIVRVNADIEPNENNVTLLYSQGQLYHEISKHGRVIYRKRISPPRQVPCE